MTLSSKILCVDDDPLVLRSVERALSGAAELTVETASSPAAARARLRSGEFAVLVTDYEMPDENGVELIESVESSCDVVPVLMTGHSQLEVSLEAINRGHVYAFISKPWKGPELVATVRHAAERFHLGRALHNKIAELEQANEALSARNEELLRAQAEVRRLYDLAATDEKTGAHSYRYFAERLEEEMARSERYGLPLALVLLDLDGFKAANDRLGHIAGDRVLRAVADVLRSKVRVMDVVARFGGDEFAVLLPNTESTGAAILGERLRLGIANAALGGASPGEVTASVGIASIPYHSARTTTEMIEAADAALYDSKAAGRNRCSMASPVQSETVPVVARRRRG